MIDELDLAFDEHAERGKPRHRRGARAADGGGGKGGRAKSTVAFLLAFVLLAGLGGGVYFGYSKVKDFFTAADYDGDGSGDVQVQIADGSTLTEMGNKLVESDVVKSTKAFTNAAAEEPLSKNIQGGTYRMRKQMSGKAAVALLLKDGSRITKGVPIPEGKTAKQTYEILSKATGIPVKDFETAAKDPEALGVPDFWFNRRDKIPARKTIEGFLFPDTYEFEPNATAEDILRAMVGRFMSVTTELGFVEKVQNDLSIAPFEALIVASLAQAESGTTADLPKVAKVAYNRVYKANMPLEFDVTTNYWFEISGRAAKHSGAMTYAEMTDPKNTFNTKTKRGLPIGPIDNPGKAALEGAQNPPTGNWLYFVAIDKSGKSAFTNDLAQHERNIQQACRNGIPLC